MGASILLVLSSSFGLVAASEMGDKTQLLAFALATRFKKPWAIMAGILTATLLNHGLASWGGLGVDPYTGNGPSDRVVPHVYWVWNLDSVP